MAQNDIYEIRSTVARPSQAVADALNVFHYRLGFEVGAVDAEAVADWFVENVLPEIVDNCPDNWLANDVFVQNLMNVSDWNQTNPNLSGVKTGTAVPPFIAGAVRSPWPGSGYNRAYKRVPGFVTTDLNDSGVWESGAQAGLAAVAVACGLVMNIGGTPLYPCTITPARPNADPPTPVVWRADVHGDWQYNNRPTTQNSRKLVPLWTATS
jgi:hypothetical protein